MPNYEVIKTSSGYHVFNGRRMIKFPAKRNSYLDPEGWTYTFKTAKEAFEAIDEHIDDNKIEGEE